jgi:2,4-dienoyl-CoA reductase-like NADH-dependent reductase (Old Yellow Enzyme family)
MKTRVIGVLEPLLQPGRIGQVEIRNRFVRTSTAETMAGAHGEVTDQLIALYETLARNAVGLLITGQMYPHVRGRCDGWQLGVHDDSLIPGLAQLVRDVHRHEAKIFAQLSHAGIQTWLRDVDPVAPSSVSGAMTGRSAQPATLEEIWEVIAAYGAAARRVVAAGFDGIQLYAGGGYLLSTFSSPLTNLRTDEWGGSAAKRDRLGVEIVRRVRSELPADRALVVKLGIFDSPPGGLQLNEGLTRARKLVDAGADAIEVSINISRNYHETVRPYVAVGRREALRDLLPHRVFAAPEREAYYRPYAVELRRATRTAILMAGGLRQVKTMSMLVSEGTVDFVGLSRPLIREPDLVRQITEGRTSLPDCTSCNICVDHGGHHSLRCWRIPRQRLFEHALYRFLGGFGRKADAASKVGPTMSGGVHVDCGMNEPPSD